MTSSKTGALSLLTLIKIGVVAYAAASYAVFAAAAAHLVTPVVAYGAVGVAIFVAVAGAHFWRRWMQDPSESLEGRAGGVWVMLAVLLVFGHVVLYPIYVRDDLIYHLAVPKMLLRTGTFPAGFDNLAATFPMLFEYPLTVIEALRGSLGGVSPFVVNLVVVALLGGTITAMLGAHFRISGRLAALLAAAVLAIPVVYDTSHTAYVELFLTLTVLLSVDELIRFERSGDVRRIYVACCFLGLAAATKYLGLVYVGLALGYLFLRVPTGRTRLTGLFVLLLAAAPWYVKNALLFGNPVFPFAAWAFPTDGLSIKRVIFFEALYGHYRLGEGWSDFARVPLYLVLGMDQTFRPGAGGFDGHFSAAILFAVGAFAWRDVRTRMACLFFVGFGLLWLLGSQQVRFLLPAAVPAVVVGFGRLAESSRFKYFAALLAVIVIPQGLAWTAIAMREDGRAALLTGQQSREAFLERWCASACLLAPRINEELDPARDRILVIGQFGRNYYYDIPATTVTYLETEPLEHAYTDKHFDPAVWEAYLNAGGFTHIQLGDGYLRDMFRDSPEYPLANFEEHIARTTRRVLAGYGAELRERIR